MLPDKDRTAEINGPGPYSQWRGFDRRGYIKIEDVVPPIDHGPRPESVKFHPLWPKDRILTPTEIYAYAMSLPGEEGQRWLFADLRQAVANLNAGVLHRTGEGQPLSPEESERKLTDLTDGAQMLLSTRFVPLVEKYEEYYLDPTAYQSVPDMERGFIRFIRYLPTEEKPSFEEYLARLRPAAPEAQG